MDIVLKSYGFFISKKGDRFVFEVKENGEVKKVEISANKVERIILGKDGTITTSAINLAIENNIPIIFLKNEEPTAMVWHCKLGKTGKIRRNQIKFSETVEGIKYASKWIERKMKNQISYLKELKKNHNHKGDFDGLVEGIKGCIDDLNDYLSKIDGNIQKRTIKDTIIGIEGLASKYYFEGINYALPEKYKFKERSRRPAKDEFNALLNYDYGMLYPIVEKCCIVAGLDPYVGFIHSDGYNKTTLVYDIIEMYRVYVDRGVVNFINKKKVKNEFFVPLHNGISLSEIGIGEFASFMNESVFNKEFEFKRKKYKLPDFIQKECYEIANYIRERYL
ncbi:CRISPR-associated endonuclease Cas1 [Methanotorris formicicus]|uniref:CRISPR-associated endonuclease Cas1 n=1 Tax=Methanotorris formicicus Mc-S-70 TaxID=647171 RepID=H1L0A9_9EURY|nr:CRISPR-associated endonuclease Cas1 [Methanotorris formicicus]EHP85066.1 CRISPR-associated protein Cas1 [Methanotorris formicicus Mc-S-70]